MRAIAFSILLVFAVPSWAGHAYSLWGDIKYPPGFAHFDYVNPKAPKGGELVAVSNLRGSTFDKYNPFTIKGTVPAYLSEMLFETLLAGSADELGTAYGLLAEDVDVAPDGLSATFKLRANARFHDGKPVLAEDVKHSFEMLISKYAQPGYRTLLEDVERAEVVNPLTVRYVFKRKNRELPLTVGSLPVFSREWGKGKTFDKVVTDTPGLWVLHYNSNRRKMDRGEMIVIDAAAKCDRYASDITRSLPIGGKFSERQKQVYEVVLGAQKAAEAALKPGITLAELTAVAKKYMDEHGGFAKYFLHGIGHHVGLDVHDLSDKSPLAAGAVITLEPGIYIADENLGIRIEDVYLVTEKGFRLLSAALPKEASEIEKALVR